MSKDCEEIGGKLSPPDNLSFAATSTGEHKEQAVTEHSATSNKVGACLYVILFSGSMTLSGFLVYFSLKKHAYTEYKIVRLLVLRCFRCTSLQKVQSCTLDSG